MSGWLVVAARPGTPWVGLLAVVAMFVLPLLPAGFWEGQRRVPLGRLRADAAERAFRDEGRRWPGAWEVGQSGASPVWGELRRERLAQRELEGRRDGRSS